MTRFKILLVILSLGFSFIPSLLRAEPQPVPAYFQSAIEKVVEGINARDAEPFVQAIDADAILDTAFSGTMIEAKWANSFREGVKTALHSRVPAQMFELMPEWGYAKLLRIKMDGDIAKALIRTDLGDNGNSYMDMHLIRTDNKEIKIVDWFTYGNGQLYTDTLRQAIAAIAPTPTLLGKIYDFASNKKEYADTVMQLLLMRKDGEHKKLARTFLSLDETLRKSRLLNIMAFESAAIASTDDFDLYGKVLKNVGQYFGDDPSMSFVLIDHYYLEGEYDKVIEISNRMQSDFGVKDAGLLGIKANALLEKGNTQEAEVLAKQAIEIEPEYEYAYMSLLNAQVAQNKFAKAVGTAEMLENRFAYELSPQALATEEFYSDFSQSAEYRKWKQIQ